MFSQTTLLGRLGSDPEVRTTASGKTVAKLRLATSEYVKGKTVTEWHTVICWEGTAKVAEKHLHKGDLIMIVGANRTRTWEKDGQKRYETQIVTGRAILKGAEAFSGAAPDPRARCGRAINHEP